MKILFRILGLFLPIALSIPASIGRADAQAILDVSALPTTSAKVHAGYKQFLIRHLPRAFALSADGSSWSFSSQTNLSDTREATNARALEACAKAAKPDQPCRLYAVDLDVVWNGEAAAPIAVPNAPEFDPFVPMKGYFLRGPAAAKGVVVWSHGTGSDDARRYPAHPDVRMLNNSGWDVYAYPRHPASDRRDVGIAGIARGMRGISGAGYKKIVLAGQSRGGWQSLTALAGPIHPFAVIAAAPGAHGGLGSSNQLKQLSEFKELLTDANNPAVRVALFLFDKDEFDDDVNKRIAYAQEILGAKGNPLMLIGKPDGITGHGGAARYLFADRYGACLVRFLESAELPKPFAC
jgi:hypothetical protein